MSQTVSYSSEQLRKQKPTTHALIVRLLKARNLIGDIAALAGVHHQTVRAIERTEIAGDKRHQMK